MQLSFFQSENWAKIQSKWTWKPLDIGGLLAFEKYTTGTRKYIFLQDLNVEYDELAQIKTQLSKFLQDKQYDFARIEINNQISLSYITALDGLGFVATNNLPTMCQIIPLNIAGDDFFAQMNSKTQTIVKNDLVADFSIILSEDLNMVTQDAESLAHLSGLGELNLSRINLNKDYLSSLLDDLYGNKNGFCVIVKHKGYIIAQMLFVTTDNQSELISASFTKYSNYQDQYKYALWQAMMELINRQSEQCVIHTNYAQINNQQNIDYAKDLTTSLGGQGYQQVGTYDLPLNKVAYKQYALSKGLNNAISGKKIKKGFKDIIKK